jgi:hypothetical protein
LRGPSSRARKVSMSSSFKNTGKNEVSKERKY